MREEDAMNILFHSNIAVGDDGSITADVPYVHLRDTGEIVLDGEFTGQELEALAFFMKKKGVL